MNLRLASPLLLAALAACETVTATPRPGAATVAPKDERCAVEFWPGAERPKRAMDELADVKVEMAPYALGSPTNPRELMRAKACALGADAIVDLHEVVGPDSTSLVGTAVRYRPL
jgi:hypothetical protein